MVAQLFKIAFASISMAVMTTPAQAVVKDASASGFT